MIGEEIGTLTGTEVRTSVRRFGSTEGWSSVRFVVRVVAGVEVGEGL